MTSYTGTLIYECTTIQGYRSNGCYLSAQESVGSSCKKYIDFDLEVCWRPRGSLSVFISLCDDTSLHVEQSRRVLPSDVGLLDQIGWTDKRQERLMTLRR